ncbi:MAG: M42 family metallopeptidase [Firmicutes bacterium]|nr:M42 family metallopeptidase [Bacillota bacterium]
MEKILKTLTELYGPSGEEETVREKILELVGKRADSTFTDQLGNLFVLFRGNAPKILISAHMDEIGIIVTNIDENGFLRLAPLGGLSPSILTGQRLRFKSGLIGLVYHEKINDLKELTWPKLYLDIGQKSRSEAEKVVAIGDLACFDQPFVSVPGSRFLAKAMDNRAGCAVLVETISGLKRPLPQEVCFVFSVQEELGLRGAKTAAFGYEPDYGLAVDVTRVGDTPKADNMAVSLGLGPAIKVKDSSVITHPLIRRFMVDQAKNLNIDYQLEVLERGGTDAGAIHLSRAGVPSGALSIPCRYVHTPSEMVDSADLENAVNLLSGLLRVPWPAVTEGHL